MGPLQHGCTDHRRIFGTWVVISNDDDIGTLSGNLAHWTTLGHVTVSPSTEHGDKTAAID